METTSSEDAFISVISIGEIAKGIALLKESRNKRSLTAWLAAFERHYADRILGIDVDTSRLWAELTALAREAGRQVSAPDGLIAATERRHGLHVMTSQSGFCVCVDRSLTRAARCCGAQYDQHRAATVRERSTLIAKPL